LCAERGTALVLITHDAALARACDRVVALADGRIAGADAVNAALAVGQE
jgi:predicted ABC-type transport system involved in lysophospholipase L1 biosynthesis ATPase subunit